MRETALVILTAALCAACVPEYGVSIPAPADHWCTTGYSSQLFIHLSLEDRGRVITTHPCYAIDVMLVGPPVTPWPTVQTSDESVLALLPLPMPAPPPGTTHEVYLAERTGTAVLSSGAPRLVPCRGFDACRAGYWAVRVNVVA